MRKTNLASLAILFAVLAGAVTSVHAVNTTGDQLSLYLALSGSCSDKNPDVHAKAITWPANSAFFVRHGWAVAGGLSDRDRAAFLGPNTTFELYVDSVEQSSATDITFRSDGTIVKLFVTNFPSGMTGVHELRGWWFIDGGLIGGTYGTEVFQAACALSVTFQ